MERPRTTQGVSIQDTVSDAFINQIHHQGFVNKPAAPLYHKATDHRAPKHDWAGDGTIEFSEFLEMMSNKIGEKDAREDIEKVFKLGENGNVDEAIDPNLFELADLESSGGPTRHSRPRNSQFQPYPAANRSLPMGSQTLLNGASLLPFDPRHQCPPAALNAWSSQLQGPPLLNSWPARCQPQMRSDTFGLARALPSTSYQTHRQGAAAAQYPSHATSQPIAPVHQRTNIGAWSSNMQSSNMQRASQMQQRVVPGDVMKRWARTLQDATLFPSMIRQGWTTGEQENPPTEDTQILISSPQTALRKRRKRRKKTPKEEETTQIRLEVANLGVLGKIEVQDQVLSCGLVT